ncbi:hypothetical protein LCGC14_1181740 [marine sediment metagenome]|uniref:C2H2-type domain-containing protein n=1 Tax=marine sediment metagenome TaxID=412755 RepID=A0A0F9PSD4_9ZZZZ
MTDYGAPYGERPEPDVGKSLGCYDCEGEFASVDELEAHERESGHGCETCGGKGGCDELGCDLPCHECNRPKKGD